ncbi:MAG: 4-alpha-glucanotransferase [Actinomycetota bacterium]
MSQPWGVASGYHTVDGRWQEAPPATMEAIWAAMGAGPVSDGAPEGAPPPDGPLFVHPGEKLALSAPSRLTLEDGAQIEVGPGTGREAPADLPLGYHRLERLEDGAPTAVVASPGRCPLPAGRAWGWAVQLYAARSLQSWGFGDLADLRRLARWSASELGAGLVLVNPLHAALPGTPQAASPYFPSSRRFRSPLYLRVEEVPGAAAAGASLDGVAAAGRALNARRLIDRDAVWRLKADALERIWTAIGGQPGPDFEQWCDDQGDGLRDYGAFCGLCEEHGRPWTAWPAEYRHPGSPAVRAYRDAHRDRARFHMWLQWCLDLQLRAASGDLAVVHDLAVGVDGAGADAWLWQDVVVAGMAVGAPPDDFNTRGQNWGVPPFDPWKLRSAGYGPWAETLRASLGRGGGVRVDHVMGLFRLFWVPEGASPTDGTYVRYPASDMLDILALESHRAGAFVVGEDLGTVEDGVRDELAARNVLSYRLLWFEPGDPQTWPEKALAAVTTHDLPTVAGLWTGSDADAQRSIGMDVNDDAAGQTRDRLRRLAAVDDGARAEAVVEGAYRALARAPCLLMTASLDDALTVEERPNMPGTTDAWPNWSIALPEPLEAVEDDPRPGRLAGLLRGDSPPGPDS